MTSGPSRSQERPRVVLVTGASSGIGRAAAHRLAGRGDHLVLLARAPAPLERAAAECRARGAATVRTWAADVGDADEVDAVVDDTVSRHGRVDRVVNAAGVAAYGRFEDVPRAVFERVLATNVLGSANVARAVLPHMRAHDDGVLVLVGSVIGQIAVPLMTPYAVSKWAIRGLGRQLHLENRDRAGVHVCVLSPGGVDTPIYAQAATYLGRAGRPPPPVDSADKVAGRAVHLLDRPRPARGVGVANPLMRLGFSLLGPVYDRLVTPLFETAALHPGHVDDTAGNVLAPVPQAEAVRGAEPSAGRTIVRNVGDRIGGRRDRSGR